VKIVDFIIVLSIVLLLTGCIQNDAPATVPVSNENEMSKNLSIKLGETFELEFQSNPSTGFEWFEQHDTTVLQLVSSKYRQNSNNRIVGNPGTQTFVFKAVGKGKTTIEFVYKRSWEKDIPPAKKVLYRVEVY